MWFEEYELGDTYTIDPFTIDLDEITRYASSYDPIPLHLDEEFAKTTRFGGIIAPGGLTAGAVWGRFVAQDVWGKEVVAGLEATNSWLAPVYPGDILSGEAVLIEKTERSPHTGDIVFKICARNQDGVDVLRIISHTIMKRKSSTKN